MSYFIRTIRTHSLLPALAVVSTTTLPACREQQSITPTEPLQLAATAPVAVQPKHIVTLDDEFTAIAERSPGFGGMFMAPDGRMTAYAVDVTQADDLRRVISETYSNRGIPAAQVNVIAGRYDFRDLAEWRRRLEREHYSTIVFSDVDEVHNRVHIGAVTRVAVEAIAGAATRAGIPDDAIKVTVMDPPLPQSPLWQSVRPVRGGQQVTITNSPYPYCTLSYVAVREWSFVPDTTGPRYVLTASHCTQVWAMLTNDTIGQATLDSNDLIGTEYSDPPLFNHSQNPDCGSSHATCRYSDAALFLLTSSSPFLSTYNGVAVVNGQQLGTAYYTGYQSSIWAGMYVHKIGRTTGETAGYVTSTCTNRQNVEADVDLLCQMAADYYADGGDSGAPVWYVDASGNRKVLGIHAGVSGDGAFFSYWAYAYAELANDILARYGVQWAPSLTMW